MDIDREESLAKVKLEINSKRKKKKTQRITHV